jgi:competence protein ComFC
MHFLDIILETIFPTKCILCGKPSAELCLECLKEAPVAMRESENWIFPSYDYRHPVIKKSLQLLKYKGKKRLAKIFAEIIYEKILEELSELSVLENFVDPVLIPIPLSPKRLHERGFNQSQLICEEIIKLNTRQQNLKIKLEKDILIKPKDTEHQAQIKDRRARLKNISGSFAIRNTKENLEKLKGKNIILIDDILTTGATLTEARKILKQAGTRKIIAFTVAH